MKDFKRVQWNVQEPVNSPMGGNYALDEANKTGSRTRLLRFQPGVYTTAPFVHDYWEEVYLLDGDLTVGNDARGQGVENFLPGTYACRPPGAAHGPFKSNRGCLLLESHYYGD